jgi:hypothetical protein
LPANIGHWLDNSIYYGALRFNKVSTGIIDDARVVQRNAEEDILLVPDFCEPIVTRELWDAVASLRQVRRERMKNARRRPTEDNGKLIVAPAPGMVLKYLLTGLLRCGLCGRSMVPSSSAIYEAKDGQAKRYVYYGCPGHLAGVYPNGKKIPEPWLRRMVVAKVRERLFPMSK